MTVSITALAHALDALLVVDQFDDYAPNGLQVEGRPDVRHVVVGVSANQALIDRAIALEADAIVVHHGFFWKNEPRTLVGHRARRVGALLTHGISLLGYHLPLDAHAAVGNNTELLRALGADPTDTFGGRPPLGWIGDLDAALPRDEVVARIAAATDRAPVSFLSGPETVRRVGVLTGGGASFFADALAAGADLFVTGEPSEQSQGYAEEWGGNFVAAGHHATERFGPRALGRHIEENFSVQVTFVDVWNPV